MKVLVAVKRVVEANVKVPGAWDGRGADVTNVKMSTNPFDGIAVARRGPGAHHVAGERGRP